MARYSREQRRRAAELYERYEHSAADVIRELGYPSKEALRMWHRDWLEERRTGIPSSRGEHYSRYTDGQRRAAVEHYLTHGRRLSRTIRQMGYPSREVLAAWIDELAPGERAVKRGPVADGVRRMAVARLVAGGVTSRQVAAEVGVEASVVRNWKRQLLHEPVPEDDPVTPDKPGKRNDGAADPDASDLDGLIAERDRVRAELERIRREKREAEIELAILKGALELVGKERGADPDNLTNREKTILVKAVSAGHGIPAGRLLARVGLARSTYYHQLNAMNRPDRDEGLLALVRDVFENSLRRYGYRRVWLELRNAGIVVSAKRVMRLMTRHGLVPLLKRARRYSSYKGELTKAPDNLVNRVFHAEEPNRLWVTDLTEFSIPAGKVYLSPVIDRVRRDAGGLDDRHEPERRAGQPDAPRRVRHARGRGASGHPLRPRLPLPVARVDQHLQGERVDPVDEREGLQSGQRGRGRVLRASQAGVLPRPELHGRHHRRVRRTVGRVHALVSGRADQARLRHQHRQTKTRARTHGIIKEQGHRSPTKRHHPQWTTTA